MALANLMLRRSGAGVCLGGHRFFIQFHILFRDHGKTLPPETPLQSGLSTVDGALREGCFDTRSLANQFTTFSE
jgi:hypothetical protein